MKKKLITALGATAVALIALTGCTSDADKASENISTAAEQFEVQRKIVGVNTRTENYLFYVEGRCSIERGGDLIVTCKHGPNDYRKHYLGGATDVSWAATQEAPIDVSVYHTRIIIKPENLLPEFDLEMGEQ